ncbi:hypothetical protein [Streptomyces sp. NPDC101181]|uniref:hypothetical protein n=1 Tax=Streptomyces sp. NPDC101181 TaxID=3366125 RepID=UPI0037FB17D9
MKRRDSGVSALLAHVPADLDVDREMTIRLDSGNRPEPGLLVYRAEADTGADPPPAPGSPGRSAEEVRALLPAAGPGPAAGNDRLSWSTPLSD